MKRNDLGREAARVLRPAPRVEGLEHRLLFAAVVTSAVGHDDVFNAALQFMQNVGGYPPWNEASGAVLRGSREITGSESAGEFGSFGPPANMPGTFYRDDVPWGLLLSTPGTGLRTSGTFGEINPTYPSTFQQRGPGKLFAAAGSTVTDAVFRVPGTDLTADTNGFGVTFTDVDSPSATTIELFSPAGASLGRYAAPPADGGLSFLGVRFNAGERVARVRITAGNTPLGPNDGGAAADVVAIDDFFYGEPQPNQPNVHRFDAGTESNRNVNNLSQPLAWARDVVPPTNGTAVLEFPFVEPRMAKRILTYDLPDGAGFDSFILTGRYDLRASSRRLVSLRNGIRASVDNRYEYTSITGFDFQLTASQAFVTGHAETRLRLDGVRVDLNGHDLTLGGTGGLEVSAYVIDGSDGGRLIVDAGPPRINVANGVYLRGGPAPLDVPGGLHVRAGRLFLSYTTTARTPVRVDAGILMVNDDRVATGPVAVNGGILEISGIADDLQVDGNATFGTAGTFATWISGSHPATPGGPPRVPVSGQMNVNGTVSLGGAALDLRGVGAVGDSFLIVANDGSDPVAGTFKNLPEGGTFSRNGRLYRVTYRGGDGNDVVVTTVAAGALDHASPGQPVRVTFAPGVNGSAVSREDLSLVNVTTGSTVPGSATTFSYDAASRTATWAFTGVQSGRLADGNYVATLDTDGLIAGAPAGDFTFDSFVLAGDINRDRAVTAGDFAILAGNFGKTGQTYATGDLTGDARVDGTDFALLAGNFGKRLDALAATVAAVQPAAAAQPTVQPSVPPASARRLIVASPSRTETAVVRHKSLAAAALRTQATLSGRPRRVL